MQVLPRDEKFFDLLVDQARNVYEASSLLAKGLTTGAAEPDSRSIAKSVRDFECRGDETLRKIYRRLHKTFITPVDPEDLHNGIDEILDHLDAVAYRFEAFALKGTHERTDTAGAILFATHLGLPVSTTHALAGSLVGVGAVQRVKAVRWGVASRILWAWILTIPAAGAVAGIVFALIKLVNQKA